MIRQISNRMDERYETLGKIGQGGLGAVYRCFDTRMNREVAIKRISTGGGDVEMREESTRQLVKEAGALAALQHPNIVTIYDVGSDADGPYVVMELISGKTLDELIERAPLTWPDFKELALQTQEALIAAHELNLIHSDLKPSNLMLTWLPSGKFQVKIVDFGLATLAHSQSRQDLETMEAVFGSIFFMPPEQFERSPLDARSDIYSMGCVYYQALAGNYPFDGSDGNEVMESHLRHAVKPLQEVRSGIPLWACDWIMWMLNRYPQDRPETTRESLSVFLKNDRIPDPPMSTGMPRKPAAPPKPRLAGERPAAPGHPQGNRAGGGDSRSPALAKLVQTSTNSDCSSGPVGGTQTAPQPLMPPEGFKPSVHTSSQEPPPVRKARPGHPHLPSPVPVAPPKKAYRLDRKAKIGIAVATALVLLAGLGLFMRLSRVKRAERTVTELIESARSPGNTQVRIDSNSLRIVLESLLNTESETRMQEIGKALAAAVASDRTDVDERVAVFATKRQDLSSAAREMLMTDVLRARANPVILPMMLEFASASDDPVLVVAALQSIRGISGPPEFDGFLEMVQSTRDNRIRDAAEENLVDILRRASDPEALYQKLKSAHGSNVKPEIQQALRRLISFCEAVKSKGR